eukprot:GHVU01144073.1.p3 GENE.GHVU01144073.1~~GHVU01144073.1.p3  ORF type:complete len:167 (+),score=29.48 GHVU01144073.1:1439-1939(+)
MVKALVAKVLDDEGTAGFAEPEWVDLEEESEEDAAFVDIAGNLLFEELEDIEPVQPEVMAEAMTTLADHLDLVNPTGLVAILRSEGLLPLQEGCGCHTMQLAVKDLFQVRNQDGKTLEELVAPMQEWVGCAKKSSKVMPALSTVGASLSVANATRWNSKLRVRRRH